MNVDGTNSSGSTPTHAGGIVERNDGPAPRFLLVRALSNSSHWVLPKGHIEDGESSRQAAIRDVLEETGVRAEILAPAGEHRFVFGGKELVVAYFHMRFVDGGTTGAERPIKWCRYEEAMELLTFADARAVLSEVAGQPATD